MPSYVASPVKPASRSSAAVSPPSRFPGRRATSRDQTRAEAVARPFADAEEAWFWFVQARLAQIEGARIKAGWVRVPRPCEPLDLLTIVDRLYRKRRLLREHLHVLAFYGQQQMAPDPTRPGDAHDAIIWREALEVLTPALSAKGLLR